MKNPGIGINSEDFSKFLASRRTTRDFLPTQIPQEILDQILKDSLTAASWSNTRPFKVAIATGEVRDRISSEFLSRWTVLSRILRKGLTNKLRILYSRYGLPTSNRSIAKPYPAELKPRSERVGRELYELFGVKRGDRAARDQQWAKNYSFFGAPVELFIYTHKSLHIYAASDAGLMMSNLMLSAHSHGLGTCAQGAVAIWDDVVRKEFNISKDYRLLCGIAIGYPSDSPVNSFQAHRIETHELIINPRNPQ
uniref:nitroreductase n=1 Tax=Candidatus Planktophila sp. TaxID=2175601 RepID=UPI00404A01E2